MRNKDFLFPEGISGGEKHGEKSFQNFLTMIVDIYRLQCDEAIREILLAFKGSGPQCLAFGNSSVGIVPFLQLNAVGIIEAAVVVYVVIISQSIKLCGERFQPFTLKSKVKVSSSSSHYFAQQF